MKGNVFRRFITFPKRALAKARDLYVQKMNGLASYGGAFGPAVAEPFPRSFSTSSVTSSHKDDDLTELIRAASSRTYGEKLDLTALDQPHRKKQPPPLSNDTAGKASAVKGVPRSASVGMAKIEEDEELYDEEDKESGVGNNNNKKIEKKGRVLFPRSRSVAVSSLNTVKRL